jgi:hypothetical protein
LVLPRRVYSPVKAIVSLWQPAALNDWKPWRKISNLLVGQLCQWPQM